jgi:lysophospholipase L1-like esterase
MLLSTMAAILLLAAVLFDLVSPLLWGEGFSGDLARIPYYADKAWTAQFVADQEAIGSSTVAYAPFTVWQRPGYRSSTVNVDDAGRRVVPAASTDPAALRVFFFGGSAMWGTSSPDWATIPNQVVELSKDRSPRPIHAVNYGESAWVSTQSVIALEQSLRRGERPEIVVFYEGANDLLLGMTNASAYEHLEYLRIETLFNSQGRGRDTATVRWPKPSLLARALLPNTFFRMDRRNQYSRVPYDWTDEELGRLADQVVSVYRTNQDLVRALATRYGFEVRFYWQPHLSYDKKPVCEAEKAMDNPQARWPRMFRRFIRQVEPRLAEIRSDDFRDLSRVFADRTEQIFTDPVHVTPDGNRLVATAMVEDLERNCRAFQGK